MFSARAFLWGACSTQIAPFRTLFASSLHDAAAVNAPRACRQASGPHSAVNRRSRTDASKHLVNRDLTLIFCETDDLRCSACRSFSRAALAIGLLERRVRPRPQQGCGNTPAEWTPSLQRTADAEQATRHKSRRSRAVVGVCNVWYESHWRAPGGQSFGEAVARWRPVSRFLRVDSSVLNVASQQVEEEEGSIVNAVERQMG